MKLPSSLIGSVCLALLILPPVSSGATSAPIAALIDRAGNTDDDRERQTLLEQLLVRSDLDAPTRQETRALVDFVREWNASTDLDFYSRQFKKKGHEDRQYIFPIRPDSPLVPLTELYNGRINAWDLIEDSTIRTGPILAPLYKNRATALFQDYTRRFPNNRIARMYLGQPIPWVRDFPHAEGAPEWAALQREQLERLREIILWWVDHRQRKDGQFGGDWGDDCEMWRWESSVLLGFDDPKIRDAELKFCLAALQRPSVKLGFSDNMWDVEHGAEETTDMLVPLMVLQPEERRWTDWGLKLGSLMAEVWTGRNQQGALQFKSFYFSSLASNDGNQPRHAFDVIANVGALHPALLVWQKTGDPKLGTIITAWLDTWVEATARAENGKPAGILPASIRWPDGRVAGARGNWWEPIVPGGFMHSYYIWPSVITEMTDAMVLAFLQSHNDKYLAPIRSMAAIRLKGLKHPPVEAPAPGSEAWCAQQLAPRVQSNSNVGGIVKTAARLKALTGTHEFDELLALEGGESVIGSTPADRQNLVAALKEGAVALRENFPGYTSEVRNTDRVMRFAQFLAKDYRFDEYYGVTIPRFELLYRMTTGDHNAPRFPQLAVRWLTPAKDIAALVTESSTTRFSAELYHFGAEARPMTAELHYLLPGRYQVKQFTDEHSATSPSTILTIEPGHVGRIQLTLPVQALYHLQISPAPSAQNRS